MNVKNRFAEIEDIKQRIFILNQMISKVKIESERGNNSIANHFGRNQELVWNGGQLEMTIETVSSGLDTIWVVLTAAMILLMEGGFALLEAGFVRSKNSVNIIMKVFADITIGTLVIFYNWFWRDVWKRFSGHYLGQAVF